METPKNAQRTRATDDATQKTSADNESDASPQPDCFCRACDKSTAAGRTPQTRKNRMQEHAEPAKPFLDTYGENVDVAEIAARIDRVFRLCGDGSSAWVYPKAGRGDWLILGCNRYSCPTCGPKKKRRLVRRIQTARPNKFITLTLPHDRPPATTETDLKTGLRKLTARIRRRQKFEYVRMIEECDDGQPHLHLLARTNYIAWQDLLADWQRSTDDRGQRIDIRQAHHRSTGYIAKYIQKSRSQDGEFSRQRMSATKNFWPQEPRTPKETEFWKVLPIKIDTTTKLKEIIETRWLERQRLGLYSFAEREPGEELPEELMHLLDEDPKSE